MATYTWDDRLTVGIAEFDAEHRSLLTTLESIADVAFRGDARPQLLATLEALFLQTRNHFETEERKMRAHGFPKFARHRAEHERLLSELSELHRSLASGSVLSVLNLHFLGRWLTEHIEEQDRPCAEFLRSKGVR